MVPSSSAGAIRALRVCFRGGFVFVSFRFFKLKENLQRCKDVFFIILTSKKPTSFRHRYVLIESGERRREADEAKKKENKDYAEK